MDCSLPGSSVHRVLQARILEWIAISYSRGSSQGFPGSLVGKESACNAGDPGLISGSERSTREAIGFSLQYSWTSLVAQRVKNPPAMWETWSIPGLGKSPGGRHGNPSQPTQPNLPGESPWREEPGGLQSMGLQRVRDG